MVATVAMAWVTDPRTVTWATRVTATRPRRTTGRTAFECACELMGREVSAAESAQITHEKETLYRELFGDDPLFRQSLGVTLWFAVLAVPLRVGFALFVAHVLNFKLRGINFFRSAFYLPSILGGSIAVAVLWRFIFSKYGLVNLVLVKLGFEPVAWLADERYSIWTIVMLFTWQFGSAMVIFLAALLVTVGLSVLSDLVRRVRNGR